MVVTYVESSRLQMVGPEDELEEVLSPVHEPQGHGGLGQVVGEEGQVDVAVDRLVVVHAQHSLTG